MSKVRVLVGLSGMPDSAIAAALLKNQGFEVIGFHVKLGGRATAGFESHCLKTSLPERARAMAKLLDIPYHEVDASERFRDAVIDSFVHETLIGRMPSPCAACNVDVKIAELMIAADSLHCPVIATGHYAQLNKDMATGEVRLYRALDLEQDQSYVLARSPQAFLSRAMFPIGTLPKSMIAKLGRELGLDTHAPQGSPGLCFVATPASREFVKANVSESLRPAGSFRALGGDLIGSHQGLYQYTLGEPVDLPIEPKPKIPLRVVGFNAVEQSVIVGHERGLLATIVWLTKMNWTHQVNGLKGIECEAKLRPSHPGAACRATIFEGGIVQLEFTEPQLLPARGQQAALYVDNELLGAGFIARAELTGSS